VDNWLFSRKAADHRKALAGAKRNPMPSLCSTDRAAGRRPEGFGRVPAGGAP
jgi:hypothetical protein